MRYCPNCGAEYVDEAEQCSDCMINLVSEAEYERIKEAEKSYREDVSEFTKVAVLENQFIAALATDALSKEKIPFIIRTHEDTAYDGIFAFQKGWGALLVPTGYVDRARPIIAQVVTETGGDSSIEHAGDKEEDLDNGS